MKGESMKFRRHPIFTIVMFAFLITYSLMLLIPLAWAVMTSFKDTFDYTNNILGLPELKYLTLENYEKAMVALSPQVGTKIVTFWRLVLNTLLYTFSYATIPLSGSVIVAYGCARYRSRWGKILYWSTIVIMVIPSIGGLASSLVVSRMIGAYDNVLVAALWNMKPNGTTFLVCYSLFKGIDMAYSEAAKIDGAGNWRIFITIILPLAKNIILAYFVTSLISYWNDWQTAMIWFPSSPTLSYALFAARGSGGGNSAAHPVYLFAGSVMIMIPMFILFIFIKDQLIGKISFGGLKG